MKRLSVLALLALSLSVDAQVPPHIQMHAQKVSYLSGKPDLHHIAVFLPEQGAYDDYLIHLKVKLKRHLTKDDVGMVNFEGVNIPGLGTQLTIKVSDGFMHNDEETKTACYTTFINETDKANNISKANKDHWRRMQVEIETTDGHGVMSTKDLQEVAMKFLQAP